MAKAARIEAVGLDVFSFLVNAVLLLPYHKIAALFRNQRIGPEMVRLAAEDYWADAQCGHIGNRERWTCILDDLGVSFDADDVEACILLEAQEVMANCRPFAGMVSTIGGLKERGLKVGILTNATPTHLALEQILELPGLVDVFLASCNEGTDKSDIEFFRQLAGQLDVPPERMLYGDDGNGHLETAKRVGFRTVRGVMGETYDRAPDDETGADHVIRSLPELLELVDQLNS